MVRIEWEKIKILVVDDDDVIRLIIKNVITKLGSQTLEARNGNEAVSLYKKEKPDLVITDILMPDKEGLETIHDIRGINPKAPIIAMSGGGNTQNLTFLQLAQKIGANHVMAKPVKPDELINAIKTILNAA